MTQSPKYIFQSKTQLFLFIAILLMAANLRTPITSVGPLLHSIQEALGLPTSLAGAITSIPLMAFALFAPTAPKLAKTHGIEKVLTSALAVLLFGLLVRPAGEIGLLFIGTLFVGLAISCGNVLLPALIKRDFSNRIGLMTGLYAVVMNSFAALGSGLAIPLAETSLGWRGSLGFWALLALTSLLFWLPVWRGQRNVIKKQVIPKQRSSRMLTSSLAWQVTIFMGLQSGLYYTLITWLPDMLMLKGIGEAEAGVLVSLQQFVLIPFTFLIPLIAARYKSQSFMLVVSAFLFLGGLASLYWGSGPWLFVAVICFGSGGGSAFSLSMMLFTLRTRTSEEAADLSGMAQSIGYLLASTGPMLAGVLHERTGSWMVPWICLVGATLALLVSGALAGRNRFVSPP
ncbi:CynX/NimT family MFS transporter [Aureibacillus halotolerans]|uniref:CP family cyanate transporter-like MFS transporter n=1 Tax=Aureibacillus halotolerans TaxID=1508390 RepID=A0A4V3D681_9BACI|nr:MFS transporter [Aureibacillus halotolerans]TDQ42877.1 CP family cyanate transporter-like MFS transporter [Aureibacillus halotolerans]